MKREKVVLTFREKLGDMLMLFGILFCVAVIGIVFIEGVSLFLVPGGYSLGESSYRLLGFMTLTGVALIRLSFYTVKK